MASLTGDAWLAICRLMGGSAPHEARLTGLKPGLSCLPCLSCLLCLIVTMEEEVGFLELNHLQAGKHS